MNTRFRVLGHSGWPEEMRSEAEYDEAEASRDRAGGAWTASSPTAPPSSITQRMNRHYQPDKLMDFLEAIKERCQFSKWFCGHYHVNQVTDKRFVIQREQISQIKANSI